MESRSKITERKANIICLADNFDCAGILNFTIPRKKKRVSERVSPRVMYVIRSEILGKTLGETLRLARLFAPKSLAKSLAESLGSDHMHDSRRDSFRDWFFYAGCKLLCQKPTAIFRIPDRASRNEVLSLSSERQVAPGFVSLVHSHTVQFIVVLACS